ncbi:MAG: nucleotide sugar dehydrogenase [Candidatus Riflebacteria bacterium]|nr:nucleotide sugar dehydrogenase [Candidatus Riflebacteria bacterium]
MPDFISIIDELKNGKTSLGVVGLGYVGLPLAHAFAKKFRVIGYDFNKKKIEVLKQGIDPTGEVPTGGLKEVKIEFTSDPKLLKNCRFIVVAVPTPVDKNKRPDLTPLIKSSESVGKNMPPGSLVVYESTVYPGVTEDECVPVLARNSEMHYLRDFKVGYSPERINPGDKEHRLETITKVVSGCDEESGKVVAEVYGGIIKAGVFLASSIKVAEAAKVIENTQRDLNIALMNELSIIFHKMGIDTLEVLAAAGTKWNFLKFFPGLVGGHCIGVDPYYLTYKAEELGYHPEVILAGRRINDGMGKFVAENTVKEMIKAGKTVKGARVLILGLTFKENVADLRNTRVIDIINELKEYEVSSDVFDPLVHPEEAEEEYGIRNISSLDAISQKYDAIVVAVSHTEFRKIPIETLAKMSSREDGKPVMIDARGLYDHSTARKAGFQYWRL